MKCKDCGLVMVHVGVGEFECEKCNSKFDDMGFPKWSQGLFERQTIKHNWKGKPQNGADAEDMTRAIAAWIADGAREAFADMEKYSDTIPDYRGQVAHHLCNILLDAADMKDDDGYFWNSRQAKDKS